MEIDHHPKRQCHFCEQLSDNLFLCPRCRSTSYCSREHRKKDWKLHKRICTGPQCSPMTSLTSLSSHVKEHLAEYIVQNLQENDFCVIDNFHASSLGFYILEEVKSLHQRGVFADGELASPDGFGRRDKKVREDKISWVSGREPHCHAIARHMIVMDALMSKCNALIRTNDVRRRTKAMVACYPGKGSHYLRHVDNPNGDGRLITTIYYLNQNWTQEHGGAMHLYPRGMKDAIKILPNFDRLLFFWSDHRNPHEVQPTYKTRYAITLWYFDTNERTRYHEKLQRKAAENQVMH